MQVEDGVLTDCQGDVKKNPLVLPRAIFSYRMSKLDLFFSPVPENRWIQLLFFSDTFRIEVQLSYREMGIPTVLKRVIRKQKGKCILMLNDSLINAAN